MGLLCDYFVAPSDDAAGATLDRSGGPGRAAAPVPARRGLFRRRSQAEVSVEEDAPLYPTVDGGGIEPVVQMGTLEALLTGRSYDEVMEAQPGGHVVAERRKGEQLVVRLSDPLTTALASASAGDLAAVARPWSQTEEFWGAAEADDLAEFLGRLAELARQAREEHAAVYCWLSV